MPRPRGDVRRVADRRYWREEDARVVVDAWRQGGESLRGFARRFGLDPKRVSRWARRLERKPVEAVALHPVQLVLPAPARSANGVGLQIEIETPDGHLIRLPAGFSSDELRRALETLRAVMGC